MNSDIVVLLDTWPKPTVVAEARVLANEHLVHLRYVTREQSVAIVAFQALVFKFGYPNDEALAGHPLSKHGVSYYSVYRVDASSWLSTLEQQNSIHRSHDRSRFTSDRAHFVITFQDTMFECIARSQAGTEPQISIYSGEAEANLEWQRLSILP